jgi:hypothetical protein
MPNEYGYPVLNDLLTDEQIARLRVSYVANEQNVDAYRIEEFFDVCLQHLYFADLIQRVANGDTRTLIGMNHDNELIEYPTEASA